MIVITTSNTDSFNNPTIVGLLEKLQEKKVEVRLVCHESYFPNPFPNVEVIRVPYSSISNAGSNPFKKLNQVLQVLSFRFNLLKLALKLKPDVVIGVDPIGLVIGRVFQQYANLLNAGKTKLDYMSFEIFFKDEGAVKQREVEACKHLSRIIIQDPLRDGLLRRENNIADSVLSIYIPVAPLHTEQEPQQGKRNLTIKEKYNLPANTKVIVNFGSFDNWAGAQWIMGVVERGLPEDVVIVVHSRNRFHPTVALHRKIMNLAASNKQLIISDAYIPEQKDTLTFLRQFDAGLTFYIADGGVYTGKNIYNIGNASGKFSSYMAAGVPVIANALPYYKTLNQQYNFGYIVNDESDFWNFLNQKHEFAPLKKNCAELFDKVLNPAPFLERYIQVLLSK